MEGLLIHRNPTSPEVLEERRAKIAGLSAAFFKVPHLSQCKTAQEYRDMRKNGTNGFPKLWQFEGAKMIEASARDGHKIPLRAVNPTNARRGFALHYHSGGYVVGSAASQDAFLVDMAKRLDMMVISVEYRMAPENKFPTPQHDCIDAAVWVLSEEGEKVIDAGGPLNFLLGDSAGSNAVALVVLALRDEFKVDVRTRIKALSMSYGLFDVSETPSNRQYKGTCLVNRQALQYYTDVGYENVPKENFKEPDVSPLYADLSDLPPAIFSCGDEDALLDDSIFMASRWHMAGNKTELQIYPEAYHCFNLNPVTESAIECNSKIAGFALQCL
ncbi:hypothetical protein PV08_04172 [Exophiala spinifera]|uniref:Alpha/beta hydrolase fold-3 domain-containing protein n=1 Tax=Exophiala spinifera TaxID=91928 RepID=A0A0D1YP94_9EURO|nr:uncharacterized protein PV08_04172 [Exophiala spinifera]KIW16981.1 hypothetical protein PV08_04172 [Exophiala spinifera]